MKSRNKHAPSKSPKPIYRVGIEPNFAQLKGRTDNFLSTLLNFSNHRTYKQAKKIVKLGNPLLIEAVDQARIAISCAALVATLPLEEQSQILLKSKKEVAVTIRSLRAKEPFSFINKRRYLDE
jgi:hypothetical protein